MFFWDFILNFTILCKNESSMSTANLTNTYIKIQDESILIGNREFHVQTWKNRSQQAHSSYLFENFIKKKSQVIQQFFLFILSIIQAWIAFAAALAVLALLLLLSSTISRELNGELISRSKCKRQASLLSSPWKTQLLSQNLTEEQSQTHQTLLAASKQHHRKLQIQNFLHKEPSQRVVFLPGPEPTDTSWNSDELIASAQDETSALTLTYEPNPWLDLDLSSVIEERFPAASAQPVPHLQSHQGELLNTPVIGESLLLWERFWDAKVVAGDFMCWWKVPTKKNNPILIGLFNHNVVMILLCTILIHVIFIACRLLSEYHFRKRGQRLGRGAPSEDVTQFARLPPKK